MEDPNKCCSFPGKWLRQLNCLLTFVIYNNETYGNYSFMFMIYSIVDHYQLRYPVRLVPTVTSRSTIKVSCRSFPRSRLSSIIIMMLSRVGNPWVLWWSEEEVNNEPPATDDTVALTVCLVVRTTLVNLRMFWLLPVRCQCYVY